MFGLPNLYVALAGVVLVALLSAAGYGLYERGNAARAELKSVQALLAQTTQDLAESEADKAYLRDLQKRLDVAVKERDARYAALQKAKKDLDAEYETLRGKVDAADQACLDRDLPDSYRERLQ